MSDLFLYENIENLSIKKIAWNNRKPTIFEARPWIMALSQKLIVYFTMIEWIIASINTRHANPTLQSICYKTHYPHEYKRISRRKNKFTSVRRVNVPSCNDALRQIEAITIVVNVLRPILKRNNRIQLVFYSQFNRSFGECQT